jgi:ABC-type transporter Mla subunit MlaD
VLKRVQDLTARLKGNESRLAASQKRLKQLTGESDSLKATVADLQATIDGLQATLESQRNTIATMEADLTGVKQQVVALSQEKAELSDTVSAISVRENTVYYIIGTRAELKERGIIKEEGGTRFLIFTRTGEVQAGQQPRPRLLPSIGGTWRSSSRSARITSWSVSEHCLQQHSAGCSSQVRVAADHLASSSGARPSSDLVER